MLLQKQISLKFLPIDNVIEKSNCNFQQVNIFALNQNILTKIEISRIKFVLADAKRKNKWFLYQIEKIKLTISMLLLKIWQPLLNRYKIYLLTEIDIQERLNSTKINND